MSAPARYTFADVRRSYSDEKWRDELYGDWGSALLYRPISMLLTSLLLRFRVRATWITILALVIVIILPAVAFWGGSDAADWVCGLALFRAVLDCVDGNIARVTGSSSRFGHYLDFSTDILFRATFYGSIGLLAAAESGVPSRLSSSALTLTVIAALLAITGRLCRVYAEGMTGKYPFARVKAEAGEVADNIRRYVFPLLSGLDTLLPFGVLLGAWFGMLPLVIAWIVTYSAADFLYSQVAILRQLA
jgi:archaetidylinositol phosphate synthase